MASDGNLASVQAAGQGQVSSLKELALQSSKKGAPDGSFLSQLTENPFFTAGFGLAGLGAAVAVGQRGLRHGASLIKRRLLVDVEINVRDESYPWFLRWMTAHQQRQLAATAPRGGSTANASNSPSSSTQPTFTERLMRKLTPGLHHLSISTSRVDLPNGAYQTHFALVPGPGRHLLRYRGAWLLVERTRETKSMDLQRGRPWETITLTTLYSQRHVFEQLFREAHAQAQAASEGKTLVYHSNSIRWEAFGEPRRKRELGSVILDKGVKERVVQDVEDFLGSAAWYHDRGIPYRRGYLLHGPPGSGKTSFIQALAGSLDYDIAALNLSERGLTDDRLAHLLSVVPRRTLVLLEDADAAFANRRAAGEVDADGFRGANVTFSGLLNALDGVASGEERILFLTTNHPERLDPALIRPGRVDMAVRLGDASRWQVERFWERFYGDLDADARWRGEFLRKLEELGVVGSQGVDGEAEGQAPHRTSTAALQGLFLYNKGDMQGAIDMAEGLLPQKLGEAAGEQPQQRQRQA